MTITITKGNFCLKTNANTLLGITALFAASAVAISPVFTLTILGATVVAFTYINKGA